MKQRIFLPLLALIVSSTFVFTNHAMPQPEDDPVAYLNKLNGFYKDIQKRTWAYTSAIAKDKNARNVDRKRTKLLEEYKEAMNTAEGWSAYNGDDTLKQSVLDFLQLNYDVLNEEYAKIVDLEAIADESYDNMEAYLKVQEEANKKMNQASEKLDEEVDNFAAKNNINLVEGEDSKLTERLIQAGKMWDYYNEIYLIFFKSYKQEVYMMDALNRNDFSAVEQNKNSMVQFATEGLEKLNEIDDFEDDNTLVEACEEILEFYVEEGEKEIPVIIDFYLKKDHFEQVSSSFESLKKKEKTQEIVDEYNKAVEEYNEAINDYNETNEELNKKRSEGLEDWNKTASKFTSKHVK